MYCILNWFIPSIFSPFYLSLFYLFSFLWYRGLNSGPTPRTTPPALFLWRVFQDKGLVNYLPGLSC
jgi:hypothetical protein